MVSLDVRKAFDTVSHHSISRALQRKGVDPGLSEYIISTLDAHTRTRVGHQVTRPIVFRRGVKQGDPLSPFLFNLVIDEIISELNNSSQGRSITPGVRVAAIGFADDLALLEDRDTAMALSLARCNRVLKARGMALNCTKSVAISAATVKGVSVPRTKAVFTIQGQAIKSIIDLQSFRYLGHHVGAAGCVKTTLFRLTKWLSNVERAPLKPDQKITLLKTYLIPRLHYGYQTSAVTAQLLAESDRLIRRSARRILHLSGHTGNQLLHATLRDGGLVITQLRMITGICYLGS